MFKMSRFVHTLPFFGGQLQKLKGKINTLVGFEFSNCETSNGQADGKS
jgi:hypothetical protein